MLAYIYQARHSLLAVIFKSNFIVPINVSKIFVVFLQLDFMLSGTKNRRFFSSCFHELRKARTGKPCLPLKYDFDV